MSVRHVLCATLALLALAIVTVKAVPSTMNVVIAADNYFTFYKNGVEVVLTDPAACCPGAASSGPSPNYQSMCLTCAYTGSIQADYGDVFAVTAVNNADATAWQGQFTWQSQKFSTGTDWQCTSGPSPPPAQSGIAWNQAGYPGMSAFFVPAEPYGQMPTSPWGYGSNLQTYFSTPYPQWIWVTGAGPVTPPVADWTSYCRWSIPAPTPILSGVSGQADGNAYVGIVSAPVGVNAWVNVPVGPFVTSITLRATLVNAGMTVKWAGNPTATLASQAYTFALSPLGSAPTTQLVDAISFDGQTKTTYTVVINRLGGSWVPLSLWNAENSAIDAICTGSTQSDGTIQGAVAYVASSAGNGQAFQFDGSTGYINVAASKMWTFLHADLQISALINFAAAPNAGACAQATAIQNPFVSASEGVSGGQQRWSFGYCSGSLAFIYSTPSGTDALVTATATWTPTVGTWYRVSVTRVDYTWTFTVDGSAVGTAQLVAGLLPYVTAPLNLGRQNAAVSRFFNGRMDAVSISVGEWMPFARVDQTMYISTTQLSTGVSSGSPLSAQYIEACATFGFIGTGAAVVMRYSALPATTTTPTVVDYFRPLDGVPFCTMIQSNTQHKWANRTAGPFVTPSYFASRLGGSATGWPVANGFGPRESLPFWGSGSPSFKASLGFGLYVAGSQSWGMPYILSIASSSCPVPNPCYVNPCQNNGTCTQSGPASPLYSCGCVPGYSGAQCQILNNNCASNPCLNGATCVNGVNFFTCNCLPGGSSVAGRCENAPTSLLNNIVITDPNNGDAPVTLIPSFTPGTFAYTAVVTSYTPSVTIKATAVDSLSKVQYSNQVEDTYETTALNIGLVYGANKVFPFLVKAQTPSFVSRYNVTVKMQLDTDQTLAPQPVGLVCPGYVVTGTASPFSITVGTLNATISCRATTNFARATVKFDNTAYAINTITTVIPLNYGVNNRVLSVRSELVSANSTGLPLNYQININRPLSGENRILYFSVTDNFGAKVVPPFYSPPNFINGTIDHDVGYGTWSIVAVDYTCSITINGSPISNNGINSGAIGFSTPTPNPVVNTYTIRVTAQNGAIQNYIVRVTMRAIPTVISNGTCVEYIPDIGLGQNHIRSIYIPVPQAWEFLTVAAKSSVVNSPVQIFIRAGALPVIQAANSVYTAASVTGSGDTYSVSSVVFLTGTKIYYVSYNMLSGTPSEVNVTFRICTQNAVPLKLDTPTQASVTINEFAFFSYTMNTSNIWSSVPFVMYPNIPAVNQTRQNFWTWAQLAGAQNSIRYYYTNYLSPTFGYNPVSGVPYTTNSGEPVGSYFAPSTILTPANGLRSVFVVHARPPRQGFVPYAMEYNITVVVKPPYPIVNSFTPSTAATLGGVSMAVNLLNFEPTGSKVSGAVYMNLFNPPLGAETITTFVCSNPVYNSARQILCIIPEIPAANKTFYNGRRSTVSVSLYGRMSAQSLAQFNWNANCIRYNVTVNGTNQEATGCWQCNPGLYQTIAQTTLCANCSIGYYTYGYGQTSCDPCESGSYTPAAGASRCTQCDPGYYSAAVAAQSCSPCEAGTYTNVPGGVYCRSCEAGEYNQQQNSTRCFDCIPGQVQPASKQTSCNDCLLGEFQQSQGQALCLPCVNGNYANDTGTSVCRACDRGQYSISAATACLECNAGAFSALPGQASCLLCGPGTYAPSTYNNFGRIGLSTCSECGPGKATAQQGDDACEDCPDGTVAPDRGFIVCTPCDVGFYWQIGSNKTACTRCPTGSFQNSTGKTFCYPCNVGSEAPTSGTIECSACKEGTFQPRFGVESCPACEKGFFQPSSGQTKCQQCGIGQFQNALGQAKCLTCPKGYYNAQLNATACTACTPGYAAPDSQDGASACTPCAVGRFTAVNASEGCTDCPAGSFQPFTGQSACTLCPAGKVQPAPGSIACTGCTPGFFQAAQGQRVCNLCNPGSFAAFENATQCEFCDAGMAQPSSAKSSCTNCTTGTASASPGAVSCTNCDPGSYAALPGSKTCTLCPIGYHQESSSKSFCETCNPGKFGGFIGQPQCADCDPGTYTAVSAATRCEDCTVGNYQSGSGEQQCLPCKAGSFINAPHATECLPCQAGHSTPYLGQIECQQCFNGTAVATTGAQYCPVCDVGTYQDSPGQNTCKRCPAGSATNSTGQAKCKLCDPGYYQSEEAQLACFPCLQGTFAATNGSERCRNCNPGSYGGRTGLSACVECEGGKAQSLPAKSECVICLPGTFSQGGATECEGCGDRTVTPNFGATACYACDQHSSNNPSFTQCLCDIGYAAKYVNTSDGSGAKEAVCVECPAGAVCDRVGLDYDNLDTEAGWWRYQDETTGEFATGVYYRCLIAAQCVGGKPKEQCAPHFVGALCAYCDVGYTESVDGACNPCGAASNSQAYSALVLVLFIGALLVCLVITVRSGAGLLELALIEEDAMAREALGYATEKLDRISDRHRYGNIITIRGPPPPKPDFTFKLKILLGFLQVVTNLSFGLALQWPPTFSAFINWFNPANLDFIKFSSVDCLGTFSYYLKVALYEIAPPCLLIGLILFYYVPCKLHIWCQRRAEAARARQRKHHGAAGGQSEEEADARDAQDAKKAKRELHAENKRIRRNFWKMLFFLLFLVYPSISAVILRLYICINIEGTSYLVTDMHVKCHTPDWNLATSIVAPTIALYPLGIPAFFFFMLYRYRNRLEEAGIRAQLGFLYDAFERKFWWFELVDALHKLTVTSIVAFLPQDIQLQAAMVVVWMYLVTVLVYSPYLRKGDDTLLRFALVEIILLLMAALTFNNVDGYSNTYNILMSTVLIITFCLFVVYFVFTSGSVLLKVCAASSFGQRLGFKAPSKKDKKAKAGTLAAELEALQIDRRTMLRTGLASLANSKQQSDMDQILQIRNPMFMADRTTAGGVLYDEMDGTEMVAMVNPLNNAATKAAVVEHHTKAAAEEALFNQKKAELKAAKEAMARAERQHDLAAQAEAKIRVEAITTEVQAREAELAAAAEKQRLEDLANARRPKRIEEDDSLMAAAGTSSNPASPVHGTGAADSASVAVAVGPESIILTALPVTDGQAAEPPSDLFRPAGTVPSHNRTATAAVAPSAQSAAAKQHSRTATAAAPIFMDFGSGGRRNAPRRRGSDEEDRKKPTATETAKASDESVVAPLASTPPDASQVPAPTVVAPPAADAPAAPAAAADGNTTAAPAADEPAPAAPPPAADS